MPRSAADRESLSRSFSCDDLLSSDSSPVRHGGSVAPGRPVHGTGTGPKRWWFTVLSVLGSAAAVAAVGCVCAFIYPILRDLRGERVRGEDGTEQRMLGFWSILVLSVLVGCICCVFSWTLTYIDSQRPSRAFTTLHTPADFRDVSGQSFFMGYGVAVLNGIMGMLTVIWSLT
ncbi:ADP-ribosylation factor-like protein 6-interacting protein 6 [Labrus bergylta]|uniref:ADP-ribosylation factor-like protein 6-interacting protein 6 n=1 Tax=Labrus bergylta TaxID=56723 RepID=UPI00331417CB